MRVNVQLKDRRLEITLQGRMDAYGCVEAQRILDSSVSPDVATAVMDLTELDYLSSAGVRLLQSDG